MMVPAISSWAAAVSLLCFIYIYIYLYIYIEKEKKSFQYEFVGYEIVGYENDGFSLLVSVIGYTKKMNMRSFQYGILLDKEESFRGLVVYSDSETYLGFNISISNLHFFFFA